LFYIKIVKKKEPPYGNNQPHQILIIELLIG